MFSPSRKFTCKTYRIRLDAALFLADIAVLELKPTQPCLLRHQ